MKEKQIQMNVEDLIATIMVKNNYCYETALLLLVIFDYLIRNNKIIDDKLFELIYSAYESNVALVMWYQWWSNL